MQTRRPQPPSGSDRKPSSARAPRHEDQRAPATRPLINPPTNRGDVIPPLAATSTTALKMARAWVNVGMKIIPIAPRAKKPLNPGGCNAPIRTWAEFLSYAQATPHLNYGVVTGHVTCLVILDVDGEDGEASLRILEERYGALPKTVEVVTGGGGRHIYFWINDCRVPCSTGKVGKNLDIRANGGYAVGAGSRHESGNFYRFKPGLNPDQIAIAPLPSWLEQLATKPRAATRANSNPSGGGIIPEGQRNATLTSIAGRLHNTGVPPEALRAALLVVNQTQCEQPLSEQEVSAIATNVTKRDVHLATTDDEAEQIMEKLLAEDFAGGRLLLYGPDGNFWTFDTTHWRVMASASLDQRILRTIQSLSRRRGSKTAGLIAQVRILLKAHRALDGDPLRFATDPPNVINCRNCELWIGEDGALDRRPHSPESYLRSCLNVDYDAQATCPRYDRAILQIFEKTEDPEKAARFWDELMGYVIQPKRPRPVIAICRGNGSNGKTKLLELLVDMLGGDLVAALPVQGLDKDRFTVGSLDGKLLLLDDDVRTGTRLPDGVLKKISESKTLTGEHKYGPPFAFKIRTVPVLLCNNPPSIADLSHGLRRRLYVVPFDRRFDNDEADPNLFSIIGACELPGVLNRYLAGLRRLLSAKWKFDAPPHVTRATNEFVTGANPLPAFIDEKCERAGSCSVGDLFLKFQDWCRDSGITYAQQRMNFTRNLKGLDYQITHGNKGDKIHGLRLRQVAADRAGAGGAQRWR